DDEPTRVRGEDLTIDARLEVEPLLEADGGELRQIRVALPVARQEHQVIVALLPLYPPPIVPASGRHVGLHADDRLESGLASLLLENPRAVHDAVVGEGEGRLLEVKGAL